MKKYPLPSLIQLLDSPPQDDMAHVQPGSETGIYFIPLCNVREFLENLLKLLPLKISATMVCVMAGVEGLCPKS